VSRLLIENIAIELGKNPSDLSDLDRRNFCILIDWCLTLITFQPGNSSTPLLKNIELSNEEASRLTAILANEIHHKAFPELDELKPDTDKMDAMFKRLGLRLGFENDIVDDVMTGFISDYELSIKEKGLVYTEYLTYKASLSREEIAALSVIKIGIKDRHRWLSSSPAFALDHAQKAITIENICSLQPPISPTAHFSYALDLLHSLTNFQHQYRRKFTDNDLQLLCNQLKSTATKITPDTLIIQTLTEVIQKINNPTIKDQMQRLLTDFIVKCPELRQWKLLSSFEPTTITRVILMGYQDIVDDEIISTVNMMYQNHPDENIAVTYSAQDVHLMKTPFTLQVIGHGVITSAQNFDANLGPFRGNATITGAQLAHLVNANPFITHLRLSCCFSGKLTESHLLGTLKVKREIQDRSSYVFTTHDQIDQSNSPFANNTAAVSCWNAINKQGREISMTVSPGIIEPDEGMGHMIYKSAPSDIAFEKGVKEIHISTNNGAKSLPLWQLKKAIKKAKDTKKPNSLVKRMSRLFIL